MSQKNVLDVFNAIVVKDSEKSNAPVLSMVSHGVVTDFRISNEVTALFKSKFAPLPIRTLFGRQERLESEPLELIKKQILHYVEVYGLGAPGLFNLEVVEGVIIKPTLVTGLTVDELGEKVRTLIYANAPIKDVAAVVDIIKYYGIAYDFALIANNELRIHLYDPAIHTFANGDDAIRYMVFKATDNSLVIKNSRAIDAIKIASIAPEFFEKNQVVLSEVFNRFKPLILAAKRKVNGSNGAFGKLSQLKMSNVSNEARINAAINQISRLSKTNHKPVFEGINKRFLAEAVKSLASGTFDKFAPVVSRLSIRDKFKILNLIEYKAKGYKTDAFVIRNGTVHIEPNRPAIKADALDAIRKLLLESLGTDLASLKGKKILLDSQVDYGLPVSRKQSFGNLPYGTMIQVDGEISSGVYWENAWGARDLDLSTVDTKGRRTGWGQFSGYGQNDVVFSGDVTSAVNGAMEFMTSKKSTYGLFVNIFAGDNNAECELVVGTASDRNSGKHNWMENVIVREKTKLTGRGSVIGFVEGNKFKVFQGKLNDRIANFKEGSPVINRATVDFWTVRKLFDALGIAYDVSAVNGVDYEFNLEYSGFSIDKLEELLYK